MRGLSLQILPLLRTHLELNFTQFSSADAAITMVVVVVVGTERL